jgi:hypothetical protein
MPIFRRINARGFGSPPLKALSKRLKLTRDVLVGHCLGRLQHAACRFHKFFSEHFVSIIAVTAVEYLITRRLARNIAQSFTRDRRDRGGLRPIRKARAACRSARRRESCRWD